MQAGKSSVRINLRIDNDFNLFGAKLRHDGIKISNPKIDHPLLIGPAEVIGVVGKWSKDRRPGFLLPRLLAVVTRHESDSQMLLVPLA